MFIIDALEKLLWWRTVLLALVSANLLLSFACLVLHLLHFKDRDS